MVVLFLLLVRLPLKKLTVSPGESFLVAYLPDTSCWFCSLIFSIYITLFVAELMVAIHLNPLRQDMQEGRRIEFEAWKSIKLLSSEKTESLYSVSELAKVNCS